MNQQVLKVLSEQLFEVIHAVADRPKLDTSWARAL